MQIEGKIMYSATSNIIDATSVIDIVTRDKYKQETEMICFITSMITTDNYEDTKSEQGQNLSITAKSFLMKVRKLYEEEASKVKFEIDEHNKIRNNR